jgi:hypothetical protein
VLESARSYRDTVPAAYAEPMSPEKQRKPARQEFEVAYFTKELGRSLQRKMLQARLDDFSDSTITAATHGDEPSADSFEAPPREDRAG